MNTDKSAVAVQTINGQEFFIPDLDNWSYFLAGGKFQGKSVYSEGLTDLITQHIELARRHEELVFGFRTFNDGSEQGMVCMLLRTPVGLQRVHIERLKCEECGWEGITANPMVSDLYIGLGDPWAAMRIAERYPVLPCPKCSSRLPRHPIWIEPH